VVVERDDEVIVDGCVDEPELILLAFLHRCDSVFACACGRSVHVPNSRKGVGER
jgi:hypothetical protein